MYLRRQLQLMKRGVLAFAADDDWYAFLSSRRTSSPFTEMNSVPGHAPAAVLVLEMAPAITRPTNHMGAREGEWRTLFLVFRVCSAQDGLGLQTSRLDRRAPREARS